MKQVLQHLGSGKTEVVEVPAPQAGPHACVIQTRASLISAGTERMLVEFSQASLIRKARQQPEKVRQVLDKIRTEGVLPTLDRVFRKLDEPLPLGYCNAGEVIEVGPGVTGLKVGDRVVSNGRHAEIVSVPQTLCAQIPDDVGDEAAAFTVLGAIGLQGIRLARPEMGETFAVFGTGLIGLMTVQMLRASGCRVLAVDLDQSRLKLAEGYGARVCNANQGDPVAAASALTEGRGVDGVLITASAKSHDIVHQAATMCRKRARIVLVGVVGLNLRRSDFYEKEISFQVSCSYGPGRYDAAYESGERDYPYGYVRWTEQRNFEAVLAAMAAGQVQTENLVTHRFPLDAAEDAYAAVSGDSCALGVILQYSEKATPRRIVDLGRPRAFRSGRCVAAMIGAGNFARMKMAPALAKTGARLKYVAARTGGAAAVHIGNKCGFEKAVTDLETIWADPDVNTVFITTRHDSHASLVQQALAAGKHVFVEKPLCLNEEELRCIVDAFNFQSAIRNSQLLMIGFNRRFSPHVKKIKELLAGRSEPLAMQFTANAGIIPPESWVHDPRAGGGRIIGEACHYIDLLSDLADSPVTSVAAFQMDGGVAVQQDKMSIILRFADGSVGTVNYFANGAGAYPKEVLEVFSQGRILRLDNFRKLEGWGFKGFRRHKTARMDKGHQAQFDAFVALVETGGFRLIAPERLINVTLATFAAVTGAAERRVIEIDTEYARIGSP